ncbi:MAG TPA: hypothetical protein VK576_07550, partial [Thermoleophilia bacterium]|nr:hypothetical protein [Thermoleophilia bacterium]
HWFAVDLSSRVAALPLPAPVKQSLVTLASHGSGTTASSLPAGAHVDPVAVHHTIDSAFVSGIHAALLVSAAALIIGAVLSATFIHRGAVAREETAVSSAVFEAQPVAAVQGGEGGREVA